jgi:PAS domain S-box-containing protein
VIEKIKQEQIYDLMMRNLPIGFSIVDREGLIFDFNNVAERITGFTKSEVIGKSHFEVLHGTSAKEACPLLQHALFKREGIVATESIIKNKNGEQIILSVTAFPLIDEEGIFMGGVELFRDITKVKRVARERKNILSMFAHDMKNPVIIAIGFLTRLLSGKAGALTDKQRDSLQMVNDNLRKVEELLTDFLEFSRLETEEYIPRVAPCNITAEIGKHIEEMRLEAKKKNIKLALDCPEDIPEAIHADARMIDRVMTNLLTNAVKYTDPHGHITVKLVKDSKDVFVHVTDTGLGIPANHIPYLFDAFYQVNRDAKGSGLGLAITKKIIEAHGGRIWVESVLGAGTTFSFTLPRHRKGEK